MNCEYCGKDMPKSYSYEVGGVVDCGCRDKKNPNNIEANRLSILLDEANKHIAELETQLETARINRELLEYKYDSLKADHETCNECNKCNES